VLSVGEKYFTVRSSAWLPSELIFQMERPVFGAYKITFLLPQLPPRPFVASVRTCGEPPLTEIFFNFPSAKKATN